jgi:hypothetical protein
VFSCSIKNQNNRAEITFLKKKIAVLKKMITFAVCKKQNKVSIIKIIKNALS